MEGFLVFKFLHIVSMVFGIAVVLGVELVVRRVAASGDAGVIRTTIERTKVLYGPVSSGLFLAGLAFGIIAALTGQIDLLRPWLITAYVLFAGAFAVGLIVLDPWVARLEAAAVGATADPSSAGVLSEVIADPRARVGSWALMALDVALLFVMVVKPLG
jgi:hypothetical protein